MIPPPFDVIMDLWADQGNRAVVERLGYPTVPAGMRAFKRQHLYPYARRKIGHIPYTHEQFERLKDLWRKERRTVAELQ